MPRPKKGEVLIKVAAAPVNPSDYGAWARPLREDDPWEPCPIGNEGSGVVVASGGGMWANSMVGRNVGFLAGASKGQGSYSEYVVLGRMAVYQMPNDIPVEDTCSFFVNPYTAFSIVDTCRKRGGKGFVHTGAASQLGQMLVKMNSDTAKDLTIIHLVRREEQAATLRALGAQHVIVTSGDAWKEELKAAITTHGLRMAFDCVAGEMTEDLMGALPKGSTVFLYGRLSGNSARVGTLDVIYFSKRLEGFLVAGSGPQAWMNFGKPIQLLRRMRRAARAVHPWLGEGGWAQSKFSDCTLETMPGRFLDMWKSSGFTNKKLRIRFGEA